MTPDWVILIPFFTLCCLLCYFVYKIYNFINKITNNFEAISECFAEIIKHITRIELTQVEQASKMGALAEKLDKLKGLLWK